MSDAETLATDREPGRDPSRRVSVALAAGVCLVVAVAAWTGGRWLSERQTSRQASRQVAVEFVLQTAEVHQQDNLASQTWVADVTGILVNSGPRPVVVQQFTWAGEEAGGPFSLTQQGSSPALSLSTLVDCHPSRGTRVPMPVAMIRVSTTGDFLSDQAPVIPNADVWDQAVERSCLALPADSELTSGLDVREVQSGSELTVLVNIRNTGSVATLVVPALDAAGFITVAVPTTTTIRPGQVLHEVLHVKVTDCHQAQTGEINGLSLNQDVNVGADSNLIRQLDRLATRTCAKT